MGEGTSSTGVERGAGQQGQGPATGGAADNAGQSQLPDLPVGSIMAALKTGEKAADNGPTWAMVYVGSLLILVAVVLAGIVPMYHHSGYGSIFTESAPYVATLIVGSGLILLAGILRLLNEMSLRREAQAQTKAYYEQLEKARKSREKAESADIAALKEGLNNGSNPPTSKGSPV